MSYRATVVTNVSYLTGSTGTFDQAPGTAPLAVGTASIYPQSAMANPILKSQLGVTVTLGAPAGQTVGFTIDSNPSNRTILGGDIAEMSQLGVVPPIPVPTYILIDGTTYAKTRAGIQAAINAAEALGVPATILFYPGDSIVWDTTPLLITKSDITLDVQNAKWLLPAGSSSVRYLNIQGSLQAAGSTLATNVAIGDRVIKMAAGAFAARGFADGDYGIITNPGSPFNFQMFRIVAHGAAGTRLAGATNDWIQISEAAAEDFLIADTATVYRVGAYGLAGAGTPPQNVKVKDVQLIGNGNTGTTSFGLFATMAVRPQLEGIFASGLPESAVYLDYVYDPQVEVRAVACGSDQTANVQSFRTSCGLIRADILDAPIRTPYTALTQGGDFNNVTNPLAVANFTTNYAGTGVVNGSVGYYIVENEVMFITSVVGGTATFNRGVDGSTNVAHPNGVAIFHAAGGFGVDVIFGNRVKVEASTSSTAGRGVKGSQVSRCTFSGKVDNARFGTTGLLVSGHDNEVIGFEAWKCGSAGLMLIGDRNVVSASSFRFNGTTDAVADIWVVSGTGNVIERSVVYGTLTDNGTASSWWSAWQAFTPTVTQGGVVTSFTAVSCQWARTGKTIHVHVYLGINNPGAAAGATAINVTLPVATSGNVTIFSAVGSAHIFDASAGLRYNANVSIASTTTVVFSSTATHVNNFLGADDFVAALAINDIITFTAMYEAAG